MEYLIPFGGFLCPKLSKNIVGQGFHTAAVSVSESEQLVCPREQQ